MQKSTFKNKYVKAFTLIELLVVISIIGMLSSVVLVSLNSARAKGRDSARIQTLGQIRNALELYYADKGTYPDGYGPVEFITSSFLVPDYISVAPTLSGTSLSLTESYYLGDENSYQLFITTETGGAFVKNNGCDGDEYATYNTGNNAYCLGNVGGNTGGGGSPGETTFTPPSGVTSKVFVIPRLDGYVDLNINCTTNLTLNGAGACYRSHDITNDLQSYVATYVSGGSPYQFDSIVPSYHPPRRGYPGGPINYDNIVIYIDFITP